MAEEGGIILNAEVDIRSSFTPFDYPNITEVIQAIEKQLPEDRLKIVKQMRGPLLGLYKITSTNYDLYKEKSITVRNVVLPITLRRRQPRIDTERTGTLITIYDAFEGPAQQIPGSKFNEYFNGFSGVKFIRITTPQFHKGTRILNGNRYLVLEFDSEKVDLGESIHIDNCQFKIHFYGQQRFCYLCQDKHGALCPEKEAFKELAAAREGKLTHKVYSDSTLRKVNQLAMAADVACTSGAGIGQLANLIAQDPNKMDEIIIVAGANEMRTTDDEQQFQFQINEASKKLHQLSATTKKITLVLPTTPRETIADEVKHEVMKETFGNVKSINVIDLPKDVIAYDGIHPTREGTAALIGLIQQSQEIGIVLNDKYLTTERHYSQVHSYFKFGCRTCDDMSYTTSMCEHCLEKCKTVDTTRLLEIAKNVYERDNPPLEHNVDMKDLLKRSLGSLTAVTDTDNDEINGDAAKKVRLENV